MVQHTLLEEAFYYIYAVVLFLVAYSCMWMIVLPELFCTKRLRNMIRGAPVIRKMTKTHPNKARKVVEIHI
uniref:G_PROTEIN_RECEP_F1_2 domain-containing protein n=1 Tax=Steinernema glaseri TaxID=37863 RepID=A0A1I7ZN80_9BILA